MVQEINRLRKRVSTLEFQIATHQHSFQADGGKYRQTDATLIYDNAEDQGKTHLTEKKSDIDDPLMILDVDVIPIKPTMKKYTKKKKKNEN